MNFDGVRNPVYWRAIRAAVTPGSVVLDLGAGLGLLGLMAAQAGARKVYLVEPEPIIEITRKIAESNGLSNVECIQATAETLNLVEKVDMLLSVFTGNFLLTEDLLPSLFHARDRFLARGGLMLPDRGRMLVAPVCMPDYYQENVENWSLAQARAHGVESYGIDYAAVRPYSANSMYYDSAKNFAAKLLAPPACLMDMDFLTATRAECDNTVKFALGESGLLHGWLGWFEMRLGQEWLDTGPDSDSTHWRQVFMPLELPVDVKENQVLRFSLKRLEYGEWTWTTDIDGHLQRQSTFLSQALTPEMMQKKSNSFKPQLSERGLATQYALSRFDGNTTTGELADFLLQNFTSSFHSREDALRLVKSLVGRCT